MLKARAVSSTKWIPSQVERKGTLPNPHVDTLMISRSNASSVLNSFYSDVIFFPAFRGVKEFSLGLVEASEETTSF